MKKIALLMLDFLNEIVHPNGVYAQKGYFQQAKEHDVVQHAARALAIARANQIPVVHVVVGFSENYIECPEGSEVFDIARQNHLLCFNTWSTDIIAELAPRPGENIIRKHRIDPFYQSNLELTLRCLGVDTVILAGISTEFVVLATAMSAHDRGFNVLVLKDAVSAISEKKHQAALEVISSIATLITTEKLPTATESETLQGTIK
ncbi:cysteine hydrolase family protein [Musicola keenii]|uniref:cysteine hydrolase family protein n=1 Tax=Musicola keenii TaxID=2884250 RepID=UPI001781CD19|nr:isochorismatase family cysteine hydrolase [Musicola keenii]